MLHDALRAERLRVGLLLPLQPAHHFVELIEAAIADRKRSPATAVINADRQSERVGQAFFQRQRIGIFRRMGLVAAFLLSAALFSDLARDLFDLAHIETARDDFVCQALSIVMAHQSARLAGVEATGMDMVPDSIGERLQPQRIGNMAAAFADHAGDVVLAVAEIADQRAIAFGLFERIEIGALHVLDDRKLQRFGIGRLDDDDRNVVQAGTLCRAPAALTGDDLVAVRNAAHGPRNDRLDDAALAQRRGELIEFGV